MDDQQAHDQIDSELLRQLREGDLGRAWAAIERHYGKMMLVTAHAKLGFVMATSNERAAGAHSATDVVQQVIVELMNRGPELADSINGPLKSYLKGAIRNRVLKTFEKDREVHAEDDKIAEYGDDTDVAGLVVGGMTVAAALDPLTDSDRYVLEQTVFAARKNADVGREIGMTGQGVGKIRNRVLRDIAQRLGGERQ